MKQIKKQKKGLFKRITGAKTFKNKVYAIILLLLGYASTLIDNDWTAFILIGLIALILFFEKDNAIQ